MKTLTKAQVFQHMADNVRADKSPVDGLRVGDGSAWTQMSQGYTISAIVMTESHFALAPRTHTLNGYDVPAPETEAPESGAKYWVLNSWDKDAVTFTHWSGTDGDRNTLKHGLWLSKEDAIANRKALRGEDPTP